MQQRGLTLVELLVMLAVAGILVTVALPGFRRLSDESHSAAALNQLVGAVHFARHAAVTHGRTVTLCPARDDTCLGRDQWHAGALVFVDLDRNGRREPEEPVVGRLPPMTGTGRVYWRSFRNRIYLQFEPRGYTAWQNGNFLYCPTDGNPRLARMIILNAQGRIRVARDRNGDGIVEDASGRPVICPV